MISLTKQNDKDFFPDSINPHLIRPEWDNGLEGVAAERFMEEYLRNNL